MAASTSDKFTDTYNAANPNVARVTVARTAGATSLSCDNLAGWPTVSKVHFSTYQINTSNAVVAGTQIDWYGIVSGNTIGSLTRITGATDAGSSIGDVVELNPTASWGHDLYGGLTNQHNLDGTHSVVTATSVATTGSVTVGSGLTVSAGSVVLPASSIAQTALPAGTIVQQVAANFSAVATGTTLIPNDDTIPQITEGNEFMTLAITPKATTNRLTIEIKAVLANSAATQDMIGALFQDATANALAATSQFMGTSGTAQQLVITHDMVAGTTSSTTFRFRAGGSVAGTMTFNGQGGTRRFGGITLSSIKITEVKV